jgi:hypothetical protein
MIGELWAVEPEGECELVWPGVGEVGAVWEERAVEAERWARWVTISTESGEIWSLVIIRLEASRTGGMWSSVVMWAGMAPLGEAGRWTGSWTFRSKIWLEALEERRGD